MNIRAASICSAMVLTAALVAGCQGYDPQPLDEAAHARQWQARDPASEPVAEYARKLALAGRQTGPFDLRDGISLPEAEVIALFFNPDLRRARAEAGIALAGAEQAGRWQDPELEINATYILENVSSPWVLGGMLKFTLPLSGRHGVEEDKAWAEHRLTLTEVVASEWQVLQDLRQHWLAAAATAEDLALTQRFIASLEQLKTRADNLAAAGALSRLDARLIELELVSRRIEAFGLETDLAELRLQLRQDLGLMPTAPLQLQLELASMDAPAQPDQVLRQRNPALRVARAQYDVSEQSLRLEIRKQYPDLVIGGGFESDQGQSRIALGLGLPIPIINLNREGIARARAARVEARTAWEGAVENAFHTLARAELRQARAALQAQQVRQQLVPLADAQAAEATRMAELGEFDAIRQLDVLTRQHEARLALLKAETDQRLAAASLLGAVGPNWRAMEKP